MQDVKWVGVVLVTLVLALGAPAYGINHGPIGGGVEGVVTDLGGGVYQYDYTVYTGGMVVVPAGDGVGPAFDPGPIGPVITSFLIPFFDPEAMAIVPGSIQSPVGWSAAFQNTADSSWSYDPLGDPDRDNYEVSADEFINPPYVLEYSSQGVDPFHAGVSADIPVLVPITGFSFQSNFSDTNGPVVIGYSNGFAVADPPHVKSPSHPAAAISGPPIPEPASLTLLGLGGLALMRRRRTATIDPGFFSRRPGRDARETIGLSEETGRR